MISFRRPVTAVAVATIAAGLLAAVAPSAAAVPPTAPPIAANPANVVRTTVLPTAQIDGTGYAQVIVGDTVYVGGAFSKARPAGVAPGGAGEVARSNLLAYSLSTGRLVANFAPVVNNTVRALEASPDGKRLYVGGQFTAIDGVARYRIASFDVATGRIVASFKPIPSYVVQALAVTNNAVYFGGKFNNVSGVTRSNLAAVQADTGRLLPWAPVTDATVQAMVLTPDRSKVVVGGNFLALNGQQVRGLGAVSVANGQTQPFAANKVVYAYGTKAAILSLTTDGKSIFGTAFNFGGTGSLEGAFSAEPAGGDINWIEDCHGDTYSAWSSGATVYTVGHAHYCANIGGFPQVATPGDANRALAFTAAAAGTVQPNQQGAYYNFAGQPAPSLRQWFPKLAGSVDSDSEQAAWSVTGKGAYVVMAGGFPSVNGEAQQGLVRFATAPTSPDTVGPTLRDNAWKLTVTEAGPTSVTLSFGSNWDRDDLSLRYRVTRDLGSGTAARNVFTTNRQAVQWSLPTITGTNTGLEPGVTYRFRVFASDAAGNTAASGFVSYTVPSS